MPPRDSRVSRNATFALKTPLQIERDHYGFKISSQWQPQDDRPNLEPRDIQLAPGSNAYYQHVVHHALMHTPIFVQWIQSHNQPAIPAHASATCIMCAYKSLVWDYWLWQGAGGHVQKLIAANHAGLTFIDTAALLAKPLAYAHGRPQDAGIFYDWVTDQMEYAIPAPLPADQRYKLQWNEEFKAMFQMDMSDTAVCQNQIGAGVCGNISITPAAAVRSIEVDFDPRFQTLEQILDYYFTDWDYLDVFCTKCRVHGPHTVRSTIRAAPQVLRIRVNIVDMAANGTTIKYLNGWTVPADLTLTGHQEIDELPLEYALSSSIAHGENRPNHYDTEVGAVEVVVPIGGDEADPAPRDIELGPEGQDAPMAEDEEEYFDPNDQYDDLFNVPERADSVMAEDEPLPVMPTASQDEDEDEEIDEDEEAAPPRDYGIPHLVPRDFVAGGFAQRIPVRSEDDHFNGLVPVTNEEFLEELGPSMDMDMDDLPNYTDTEGEDDDEDEQEYELEELEHLNRSDGSASPPQDGSDAGNDEILDDFFVEVVNNNVQIEYIADEDITEAPHQLDDDMYDTDEEPVVPNSHYILNVRGPGDNKYHISKAHHNRLVPDALPLETLSSNPQRPWHMPCHNPKGYQVVTLTYTRKPLVGKWGKMERNIPAFI